MDAEQTELKRKPGRPKGSKNKPHLAREPMPPLVPPSTTPLGDYAHPDPAAIVSRQLALLDWGQQAIRNEMQRAMQSSGVRFCLEDVQKLQAMSNAIVRAMDAMRKSSDLADELASRKTPAELLEIALKKIEGQDLATLNYAIKRLRAHRERLAPVNASDCKMMGETATDAIASLAEETE